MGEKITKEHWDKFIKENNIKYFSFNEFVRDENGFIDSELVKKLEKLREAFGKVIKISSGYRTEEDNKRVGGAKNSYHLKGMAVDIPITEYSASELYSLIKLCFDIEFNGIILYPMHLHLDIREDKKVFIITNYKRR